MCFHPVAFGLERAEFVERLAADHVDEEPHRLIEVRHGEADVFGATQAGQARLLCADPG